MIGAAAVPDVLLLPASASAADRERCRELAGFLRRRALAEGAQAGEEGSGPQDSDFAAALLRLADKGLLSFAEAASGEVEVFYVASPAAAESVLAAGADSGFPEPVQKKQAAAFRCSQGALFRFPAEEADGALEVFITDWSPCPAACAVAIHRSHPFAADLDKPGGSWFTGRYVRHPLTGDLLPVWVADWVRPDFGTGAVLVNPAHDATDLAFGRAVGLPIRFALVPVGDDGSPAAWPAPPVVRSGRTIRTGPYDGLDAGEASERYFEVLAARGLARRHRDVQAGQRTIGRLMPDPRGDLAWSAARAAVLPAAAGAPRFRLAEAELLAAALAVGPDSRPLLVCPASELTGSLLTLRLLRLDLAGSPLVPAGVLAVQKVQESSGEAAAQVVRLAAFLGAPIQQVAVIKQQTLELMQRFLRVHGELLARAAEASGLAQGAGAPVRALSAVKAAVLATDPARAFALLQQVQKQLAELPAEKSAGALPGYFALAHVVTGLETPAGIAVETIWRQL